MASRAAGVGASLCSAEDGHAPKDEWRLLLEQEFLGLGTPTPHSTMASHAAGVRAKFYSAEDGPAPKGESRHPWHKSSWD
ncbi:hypothetical protein NDU88_005565 [Pleurodeles waltl]|uniref:Uncharacterized protein n=1 Tax=Pleurodeles waltl TaxID=8319 RepID=A0AAV7N1M9_PLEWA|nr:hypothetical protein NDU88_005565 [Pleurodeles waltl]